MGYALTRAGFTLLILSFILFLLFVFPRVSLASSDYVLPYPSAMPGSKLYFLHKIEEKISKYWYFGDYGSFTYNRHFADKYLVEAKTLFEYRQYVLALQSLSMSNHYFKKMQSSLENTPHTKYGREEKKALMKNVAEKHLEVLQMLGLNLPNDFIWKDENMSARILDISGDIGFAELIRKEVL